MLYIAITEKFWPSLVGVAFSGQLFICKFNVYANKDHDGFTT